LLSSGGAEGHADRHGGWHFAQQIRIASDVPKIASNNRLPGTPGKDAAINQKSLSLFGSYSVDEDNRTVTTNVISSTFPTGRVMSQTRLRP
jgi:hypothetical protein